MMRPASRTRHRMIGVGLKMYMRLHRTREWMAGLADMVRDGLPENVDLFVIPSFLTMQDAGAALSGTRAPLGAQNVFWEDSGAYTGEVSAQMLAEVGCRFVEIGHAGRRLFGEADEIVALKITAAVRAGLTPVLGEGARGTPEVATAACIRQLEAATSGIGTEAPLIVAYEPISRSGRSARPRRHRRISSWRLCTVCRNGSRPARTPGSSMAAVPARGSRPSRHGRGRPVSGPVRPRYNGSRGRTPRGGRGVSTGGVEA